MDMNADDAATNLAQIGVRLQQLARWLRVAPGAGGEAATELVRATRRDLVELEQQVTRRRRYALAVEVKDLLARHSLPLRLHLGAEGAGVPGWVNCGRGLRVAP
ncbi:MAG: hypothetical protein IPO08_05185 [Xanthomonadales bacterium]|nr:hypothetical protein [Xanthomonadales bacterium]